MEPKLKGSVWVTGAKGLIGSYLARTMPSCLATTDVHWLSREQLDLTDFKAVELLFRKTKPSLVIHAAAMSRSVDCQKNPEAAWLNNFEVTKFLSELFEQHRLIFFSTDLVFDGLKGNYSEADRTNPLSIYGETKVAAENAVLSHTNHLIIRTSLNGGVSESGNRAFNEELKQAWNVGKATKLFTDEFRSPIAAIETAKAVWTLALNSEVKGMLHVAGSQRLSRYEIGALLAKRWKESEVKLEAASLKSYQGPPRAPDTSLGVSKAQARLPTSLPKFSDWLEQNPHEPF